MTIKRTINGSEIEIELTKEEIYDAYCVQEYEWDVQSCRNYLNSGVYVDEEWYEELDKETEDLLVAETAYHLRRNINKYEMSYDYAISDAFSVVLVDYAY